MQPFAIEIYWPGMTASDVDGVVDRVLEAEDTAVLRYVGCTVAPRDETCFVRVEARNEAAVQRLVESLAIDGARITELVEIARGGPSAT